MARAPVLAAGGIVTRRDGEPLIAVVRLRKRNEWVLPKGKLDDGETARDAAAREVLEETGHRVAVHEFLGTLACEAGGRNKIVHYWRMEAERERTGELMRDIRAVEWLPLEAAVERLTRMHERAFLAEVGPRALEAAARPAPPAPRSRAPRVPAATPLAGAMPLADRNAEPPVMSRQRAEPEPVGESGKATDIVAAVKIAAAESPALAPEPISRAVPVAPRKASRTWFGQAWSWLTKRT
jgi:8-oxo-dGTP diphosphatase